MIQKMFPLIPQACLGLLTMLVNAGCEKSPAHAGSESKAPLCEKIGNRITIPEQSPLRKHLAFEPVVESTNTVVRRFTGMIEADPVRLSHVFPTVSGRLVKLLVKLGDSVVEGQPLALIHAPELVSAQAQKQVQAGELKAQLEIRQALAAYRAASATVSRYRGSILKDAATVLEARRASYQKGQATLLELLEAQRTAREVRVGFENALVDQARGLIELQRTAQLWELRF